MTEAGEIRNSPLNKLMMIKTNKD